MLVFPITVLHGDTTGEIVVIGTTFTAASWEDHIDPDRISIDAAHIDTLDAGWPVVPVAVHEAELITSKGKRVATETDLACFVQALLWKHGHLSATCDPRAVKIFEALLEVWPQAYLADVHDLAIYATAILEAPSSQKAPVWCLGNAINSIPGWTEPGGWLERLQDQVKASVVAAKVWAKEGTS